MKKIYTILSFAVLALPVMAQQPQLPNSGFEDEWQKCRPFTSQIPDETATDENIYKGTTPSPWTISNVIGIAGLGATQVGEQVAGYESEKAVCLRNTANSLMSSQIVPGYITLGTSWNCSIMGNENDGGSFGGVEFTGRPEKITFMYKYERANENTDPASAVAYLWKGTTTQVEVPAGIGFMSESPTVTMTNRDRNILGIETSKGGEVTKSDDFELIAKGSVTISDVTDGWAKGEIVFEYLSDATPEMINVIFSANDYFTTTVTAGNALTVDNICAVYPAPEADVYAGKLVVVMNGGELTGEGGDDATIKITPTSETTCNFLLPNFALGEMAIGDINVENVSMITDNGTTTYKGEVKGLQLLEGAIQADVTVNGTGTADGKLSMQIDVMWMGMPVTCTFNGTKETSDIAEITTEYPAAVEYYNLKGVRVNENALESGIYIRRQGNKVTKVIIR